MSVIEAAVQWSIQTANDNTHGYSQTVRWSPDYDCSSFVISAFKHAGIPLESTYTGNMYADFMSHGFTDVTKAINLTTGAGLKRGDVLLNVLNHTCIYIGSGQVVNCRTDTDGKQGDSHGDEIRIQSYWDFRPWNYVLRYQEDPSEENTNAPIIPNTTISTPVSTTYTNVIKMQSPLPLLTKVIEQEERDDVEALQALLALRGFGKGTINKRYDADTQNAVAEAQRAYGILADSECGKDCWAKLITNGK